MKSNQPPWCTLFSQKAGISEYKVQNNKEFSLIPDTPSHGMKRMYNLHLTLMVSNNEIYNIKNEANIISSVKFPVIFLGSSVLYPNEYLERLWFRESDESSEQMSIVSKK